MKNDVWRKVETNMLDKDKDEQEQEERRKKHSLYSYAIDVNCVFPNENEENDG